MSDIQESPYTKKRYPIKLGSSHNRYSLVLYENRDKYEALLNILYYNKNFNERQCFYCELLPYAGVKFHNRKWDEIEGKVLVLYSEPMGSGGFVSYEVIGEENNSIKKYISQEFIFQGRIFFKDGQLIQGQGNQFKVWEKENDKFALRPYSMPPYPDAYVIKYSVVDKDTVKIDESHISVPVNSVVQFVREDFNDVTERLLFSNDSDCLRYIQHATFKITCKSKTTATIIPSGYNWDGAKKIVIEAK